MLEGVNSEDKEMVTTVKGVIKAVLDGVKVPVQVPDRPGQGLKSNLPADACHIRSCSQPSNIRMSFCVSGVGALYPITTYFSQDWCKWLLWKSCPEQSALTEHCIKSSVSLRSIVLAEHAYQLDKIQWRSFSQ